MPNDYDLFSMEMNSIDLKRMAMTSSSLVDPKGLMHRFNVRAYMNDVLQMQVFELSCEVYATEPEVVEVSEPATWWDHLKEAIADRGGWLWHITSRLCEAPAYTTTRVEVSKLVGGLPEFPPDHKTHVRVVVASPKRGRVKTY